MCYICVIDTPALCNELCMREIFIYIDPQLKYSSMCCNIILSLIRLCKTEALGNLYQEKKY